MSDDIEVDLDDLERRMDGAVSALRADFATLRTGRASASMLDAITVEAYVKITDTESQSIIISFDRSEYWRLAVGNDVDEEQGRVFWATHTASEVHDKPPWTATNVASTSSGAFARIAPKVPCCWWMTWSPPGPRLPNWQRHCVAPAHLRSTSGPPLPPPTSTDALLH